LRGAGLAGALNARSGCATVGVKEFRGMSRPPSQPGRPAHAERSCSRSLSLLELSVVLEELDRVVGELEESLTELGLPFDEDSRAVARAAIAAARRI
jgi:hypothetical protein